MGEQVCENPGHFWQKWWFTSSVVLFLSSRFSGRWKHQPLISKFLVGILLLHVVSFVFLEVATFLALKHTGLVLSSCLIEVSILKIYFCYGTFSVCSILCVPVDILSDTDHTWYLLGIILSFGEENHHKNIWIYSSPFPRLASI